jgi:N-acetylgalactosamine kinase
VNIIGEHVDYHGYSVLPCALEQDVVIAVGELTRIIVCMCALCAKKATRAGTTAALGAAVVVANTNTKYEAGSFPTDPSAEVDRTAGLKWWQYVQCGYKGAFDAAPEGRRAPSVGVRLVVDGRVPAAAGVSSSSALVVAATLAVSRANGINVRSS